LLSKGLPTATVMCKYLVFKGATNSNCDVQELCLLRGTNNNFKYESTILSMGPHHHLQCGNKEKLPTNFYT